MVSAWFLPTYRPGTTFCTFIEAYLISLTIKYVKLFRAESLAAQLSSHGHAALSISGSQTQTKRLQTLLKLRQYQCKILVATDLAARGIDAENVDLVIHIDVPRDPSTYLHRVGRAGRFGAAAIACSIACEGNELTDLRSIITKTRASVRILSTEHVTPSDPLSIQALDALWQTLPELEGTGLEGEGAFDSLLTDIEHNRRPLSDSTKALLPSKRQKTTKTKEKSRPIAPPKPSPPPEPEQLEESVSHLSITSEEATEAEATATATNEAWQDWYWSWIDYIRRNKELVQQLEYVRLMPSDSIL